MKLYLSKIKYRDKDFNVLNFRFLKSPDKNLIVFDCKERILSFYILGNKIPGPIKFQLKNKSRLLVFSEISRFDCKVNKYYKHYTSVYYASEFEEAVSDVIGNKSGILCRWDSDYMPMYKRDVDKVLMFFNALRNEEIISKWSI